MEQNSALTNAKSAQNPIFAALFRATPENFLNVYALPDAHGRGTRVRCAGAVRGGCGHGEARRKRSDGVAQGRLRRGLINTSLSGSDSVRFLQVFADSTDETDEFGCRSVNFGV